MAMRWMMPTRPIGRRTAQIAAAATLALLLGGTAARHAAAEPIDTNVAGAVQDCQGIGGTASVDWTFDDNGAAVEAVVSCDDGGDGWYLCADNAGYDCDGAPADLTGGGRRLGDRLPDIGNLLGGGTTVSDSSGGTGIGVIGGDATSPTTGGDGGTAAPSDPTLPGGGALPGTGQAPKPHKGHTHHGRKPAQMQPVTVKANATAHHAKAKAAAHGKHAAK